MIHLFISSVMLISNILFNMWRLKRSMKVSLVNFQKEIEMGIYAAILEEVIFRHGLYLYTREWEYCYILNSVSFGLWHLMDYKKFTSGEMVYRIISPTLFGYFLVSLENFWFSLFLHLTINILGLIISARILRNQLIRVD